MSYSHKPFKKVNCALLVSLIIGFSVESFAAEPEKILINADRMQMDIKTGDSTYTGNVKLSQGELVLTGDMVTLESRNKELENLVVIGKPARYNHVTETGERIKAESERMVYTASQNKLVMTINAHLQQPDHTLSSQKIVYDTKKRVVIAGTESSGNKIEESQRVKIILTPKKAQAEK